VWPVEPATSLGDLFAPRTDAKNAEEEFLLNLFATFMVLKSNIPARPLQVSQ
jgi:hypothetical protein